MPVRRLLVFAFLAVAIAACRPLRVVERAIRPATPHEQYANALGSAGLAASALAREWLAASESAVRQPVPVALPFAEESYLDPARPRALGYLVALERGQRLDVQAAITAGDASAVFVDAFERAAEGAALPRSLASANTGTLTVNFEASAAGEYVVRVQPELLRGGRLRITSSAAPSMAFPVSGASGRDLQSQFGAARDGGRRAHEGIDIFAKRGTPVLSATNGIVGSVGENDLGGLVVWVFDPSRQLTLYYAHLDTQLARAGQRVVVGDTLGTVGNTGNARTTAPHLHFGIYAGGEGALDPLGYIRPVETTPPAIAANLAGLGEWARTRSAVDARPAPLSSAGRLARLPRATPFRAEGAIGAWVRARLPDGQAAFVATGDVELSAKPIETVRSRSAQPLRAGSGAAAPVVTTLAANQRLAVIGRYEGQLFVESEDGVRGWVAAEVSR